jgi:hypothetical protein|tara:strand:+ start:2401 stop:2904 length:504 start_codon:yes stop_codon:yes gene_type:complete
MGKYASDKYALGISDRSGAAYKLRHMRKEWTGMLVGKDEWESKQPQLNPVRVVGDPQALRNARPDRTEPAVTVLLQYNAFLSGSSGSAVITVIQPGHGKSTGDTVCFRSVEDFDGFTSTAIEAAAGFSITKVNDDRYTFTAGSGTATAGNVNGGGGSSSAGPVTVSA